MSVVRAIVTALGEEFAAWHERLRALFEESDPRVTDEMLAEWERAWGLPLCNNAPDTEDERRGALSAKVAAVGGQTPAYYLHLVRVALGDPEASVTIVEWPYGRPFYAWLGHAWDPLGSPGLAHHWRVILPAGTSLALTHIIRCLLERFKPAHTVLEIIGAVSALYSSPGGASDYIEASSVLAARRVFAGAGVETFTLIAWVQQPTASGANIVEIGDYPSGDSLATFAVGRDEQEIDLIDGGAGVDSDHVTPPDDDSWWCFELTSNGTTITARADGVASGTITISGTYAAQDLFRMLTSNGEPGKVRNIAMFERQLTSDERAALLIAGYTHDLRLPVDDGSDWAGETPPLLWCTEAEALPVVYIYTAVAGEQLIAAGYSTIPDPEDATIWFRFRVNNDQDGVIWDGDDDVFYLFAVDNDGTTFGLEVFENSFVGGPFDVGVWYSVAVISNGSEVYFRIAAESDGNVSFGEIDGNFRFGHESGTIDVSIAQIFVFGRQLEIDEIVALDALSMTFDPSEASGDWPGIEPIIAWTSNLDGDVVPNSGTGDVHPLTFSGTPNATPSGPTARVANSGTAGECYLYLNGDVTSEED